MKCERCGDAIRSVDHAALEFVGRSGTHPETDAPRVLLRHHHCAHESGFRLSALSLLHFGVDGEQGWIAQLSVEPWWQWWWMTEALRDAYERVVELQESDTRNDLALARAARVFGRKPRVYSQNPRHISPKVRAWVMERDGFRCRRCGGKAPDVQLVIDHIKPVASGGTGEPDNLQTLCRACNAGKAARAPHAHDLAGVTR